MPLLTEIEILRFRRYQLTARERSAIKLAEKSLNPWKHSSFPEPTKTHLESAKNKIRQFHLARTSNSCCYCRRPLRDAEIETDREHIIPKGNKKHLSYNIFNLSVSCKRCNMTYKKERIDHIVDFNTIEGDMFNTARYKIPHPNIERLESHIIRCSLQIGTNEVTFYRRKSIKGKYLYTFVNLKELSVVQLDLLQAGRRVSERVSALFRMPSKGI